MNSWPDRDGGTIDRYVRQLRTRHSRTAVLYRSELLKFQRFIEAQHELSVASITGWLRMRAAQWPLYLLIDRACKIDRFLGFVVSEGTLATQPFNMLRSQYGVRAVAQIVRSLLEADPLASLEAQRPLPRFGSFLGPLMREHIELRRSLGYRYSTQAARFARFDRFLQARPDLEGRPLTTLVSEWQTTASTIEQRWACQLLGQDLAKAWSRIDSSVGKFSADRHLRLRLARERRRPHVYTPEEVCKVLETARALPSPRAPLRPPTLHAMLVLAYCAGLRLGELVRLDLRDVSLEDGTVTIRESKFFKSRRLPLSEGALSSLREYLLVRAEHGGSREATSPLFWRAARLGGGRYALITAEILLIRVLRRAGLKPAHGRRGPRVHDLRHSFVAHRMLEWYRAGVDVQTHLPYLSTYLGHRDLNSTVVYLNMSPQLLGLASARFRDYARRAGLHSGTEHPCITFP